MISSKPTLVAIFSVLVLGACAGKGKDPDTGASSVEADTTIPDQDGDGYTDDVDCNDKSTAINPGASESCNGYDDDCDGEIDEDDAINATEWYSDADEDGYGDASTATTSCEQPSGLIADGTDCNDADNTIHPGMDETCDDIDNNCDDEVDEDNAIDAGTWYQDSDGDGYGDPSTSTSSCEESSGWVADSSDCDDENEEVYQGAPEICDDIDNDCDGDVDNDATDALTYYADDDSDYFGDPTASIESCDQPDSYVTDNTDCDDDAYGVNPSRTEICDEIDNDCDEFVDDEDSDLVGGGSFYGDFDEDGYGDPDIETEACTQPSGYADNDDDCDDSDSSINPAASEVCDDDNADDDCDGLSDDEDESVDTGSYGAWYIDADEDGYGDPDVSTSACDAPSGYVDNNEDCDDTSAEISPDMSEIADDKTDNNCDGEVDETEDDCADETDNDGDGATDCDDKDCVADEACVEICDDGDDNDGDELTDCDDEDCVADEACVETCDDGDDNDDDGLADCEDADCFDDGACIETCDDGDDNDGDGWSDCQDDDCWGVAPCLDSHRVTLYGGTGVLHIEAAKGDDWEAKAGLTLYSVAGEVQVKTSYGSFATCAFSFEYGHLSGYGVGTGVNTSMVFPKITRSDFLIESGCDFKDDTAMPSFITLPKPGQLPMNAVIPFETTDGSTYRVSSTWYNGTVISGGYRYLLNTSTSARHTAFSIPGGTSIVIGE